MVKPSLILLHGALGAAAQFESWIPELERTFHIRTMDFEGHGGRGHTDRPFAIEHFTENLEEFIVNIGQGPADIFGYSMGGYVALHLALKQPELVRRIFTFATKVAWNAESAAHEANMLDPDTVQDKTPKYVERLQSLHQGKDWRLQLELTADMMLDLGEFPTIRAKDFKNIRQPVRLGVGDRDNMVTLEETIAAFQLIPDCQLFVMPGTAHPLEKIGQKQICASISQFFC
jgi:pimeloyl-ACP methyl ester carboxylesterase